MEEGVSILMTTALCEDDDAYIMSAGRCKNCQRVIQVPGRVVPAFCSDDCVSEYHDYKSHYFPADFEDSTGQLFM